jgi:SAM-dependent methyltransferase
MPYPGIAEHLTGEFIEGFLETPDLRWSGEAYDMVTLFDVLEHVYRPQEAFSNLRSLVKPGGMVFVETGNTRTFWPSFFGLHHWWYVRLMEHHIFWSRRSLERIAAAHGFELVFWNEERHKSRRRLTSARIATDLLKAGLYMVDTNSYVWLARLLGKDGRQPWYPFTKDHFQACLQRK